MADRQQLLAYLRAAVERYEMIAAGDRVAVGVSGGKDSLALLSLMAAFREFSPLPFSLIALTADPCFGGEDTDYSAVAALCERLEVPYVIRRTKLFEVVTERSGGKTPCSLCAKMRRGILHRAAAEEGCNVVALGHHKDDAAETVMMNLLSGGRFACFSPKTELDRSGLTLIRPLIFASEQEIASFVRREELPVVKSRCPVDGDTHRAAVKAQLSALSKEYGDISEKILNALQKSGLNGW